MAKRDERRAAAIEAMADHVLAAGLPGASLRPLAAAAGTSDRMLLYYFTDKDELIGHVLARLAERLAAMLDSALPTGTRLPEPALRAALWKGIRAPEVQPYIRVLLDLAAAAARGQEPQRRIGGEIADFFLRWAIERLDAPAAELESRAAALFAMIEGAVLTDALGRPDIADRAILGK